MPKTFLAVNLSDAFTFEEQEKQTSDNEALDAKTTPPVDLLLSPPPANGSAEAGKNGDKVEGGKVVNPE